MAYSNNENLFWELLDLSDATLIVDNDMCIVQANYNQDTEEFETCESFDFGPTDLVFLLAAKLEIETERV